MSTEVYWRDDVLVIMCDECEEEAEYDMHGVFQNAIDAAKSEGWHIRPSDDTSEGWTHLCNECRTRQTRGRYFDFDDDDSDKSIGWVPR